MEAWDETSDGNVNEAGRGKGGSASSLIRDIERPPAPEHFPEAGGWLSEQASDETLAGLLFA